MSELRELVAQRLCAMSDRNNHNSCNLIAGVVLDEIAQSHVLIDRATADAIRAFLVLVGNEGPWFGSDGWELVAAWRGDTEDEDDAGPMSDQLVTITCSHCGGSGAISWYEWDADYGELEEDDCPVCEGTGKMPVAVPSEFDTDGTQ